MLKRFLVFHGQVYYPQEGMKDFLDSFDDEEVAISVAKGLVGCKEQHALSEEWSVESEWSCVYDTVSNSHIFEINM